MSTVNAFEPNKETADPSEITRALIATVFAVGFCALFALAPGRDPAKVVPGVPCSVLSENAISGVMGAPMRLMPTSGTVCQYVSTAAEDQRTLFVIARHDAAPPHGWMAQNSVQINGLGNAAYRTDNALYVRYGSHAYTFHVVPQGGDAQTFAQEVHLAKMMRPSLVAENR